MSITVLVTGATGFVGSHVLAALQQQPEIQVIAACRDPSRLTHFHGEVRQGDLRDDNYLKTLLMGVDVVCHAAAWTSLWGHRQESDLFYLQPTLRLLTAIEKSQVKRVISISTTSAAAPTDSADASSMGIPRHFWPHLNNVIRIENELRRRAGKITMVNLRLGVFAGNHYALSVLPVLLPRLKTHLVPWVQGGRTHLPIIDGRDIGQAFLRAVLAQGLQGYESFNIVGPTQPTVREVIELIHQEFGFPKPHYSVPFAVAYPFAALMEWLDRFVPWEPLVTRSIIHLLEEVNVSNDLATRRLGYQPIIPWQESIRNQFAELQQRMETAMPLARPL